jgi:hypothetical protein
MKRFQFVRNEDVSGVSGVGVVFEGIQFTDGTVVIRWLSKLRTTAVYASIEELEAIHGHEGKGHVEWIDA